MQQAAGGQRGSDVFVGQILNIVLSELRALHNGQMLEQLSHVATLVLLQQHQRDLRKQHHLSPNAQLLGTKWTDHLHNDLLGEVVSKLNVSSVRRYVTYK